MNTNDIVHISQESFVERLLQLYTGSSVPCEFFYFTSILICSYKPINNTGNEINDNPSDNLELIQ